MGDRQQTFRAVLHREGDEWVAHCLDLDIVATGGTQGAAAQELAAAVTAQLDYAHDEDNYAYLFHPAPPDAWRRLGAALQGAEATLVLNVPNRSLPTRLELQVAA